MTLQSSTLIAVLAGYGRLIGVGGLLADLERRQAHRQLVVAVVDGLTSGNDGHAELWRYTPFGLTAWLEPGGSTAPSGPQLLESGGQSWMQSRTPVLLPQRGGHTLVVRQNVTSSIARQRTLLLLLLAAAGLASLFTAALLRPVLRRDLVRPIDSLCSRLQAISGLQWVRGPVLSPEEQPQELQPIAESFRALQRRLAAAWKRERTFTDGVAHELRTPITLISGQAQSLLRQPLADEQRRAVVSIAAEARHMTTLVRDLLDLARQDGDRLELQCRPVDPEALMLDAFDRLRPLAPQRLQLVPAGAAVPPEAVQADPDRLLQCISALVDNALAYSIGPVELELCAYPNQVVWHVRDRGPGVQPKERAAIFQRFVRGSAAAHSDSRGSGLGLAVVRLLMEAMGGWVAVAAVPGGGADFQLRLPLRDPAVSSSQLSPPAHPAAD
jgi:signal transduction histidine kinase